MCYGVPVNANEEWIIEEWIKAHRRDADFWAKLWSRWGGVVDWRATQRRDAYEDSTVVLLDGRVIPLRSRREAVS